MDLRCLFDEEIDAQIKNKQSRVILSVSPTFSLGDVGDNVGRYASILNSKQQDSKMDVLRYG